MIRFVARRLDPVGPATTGAEVYDRFEREAGVLAIAVTDEEGRVVGLVERNDFFLKMAADYGRALFAKRPISVVMNKTPIIVDAKTQLTHFLSGAVETSAETLLKGFVVTENGRYFGVGTALDLLVGAFEENTRRADDLAQARDSAEAANRAKSEFLATMSHEIRTPLNGVLGVASALMRTRLDARQKEMVRLVESSAESLQVLLADVLDLARVEAGRLEISAEPFDLREATFAVAELFRAKAEEKGLSLAIHITRAVPQRVMGDVVRLKQILGNLLSNAVKFTEAGHVRLDVEASDGAEGQSLVRFRVADTGIGFDAAAKMRLFSRFVQADGSITRRFGGSGLGLAISNALAELMDGAISADSTVGEGSIFILTLPFRAATALPANDGGPEAESLSLPPLRILLAEDHPVNRKVVELIFEGLDVQLVMAEDGVEAVERFAEGGFDLLLMDMQMPRMDGLEAIAAIRAAERASGAAPTPVVMLTANALPEHQAAGFTAGADAFLAKPIVAQDLLATVSDSLKAAARENSSLPQVLAAV